MATLKEPVKIFIVQALACRDTPQEVAEAVKQEFKIELDRRQCASYDPTKPAGQNLSKKFVQLFNETCEKFDAGLIDIPIANKHFRLKQYQKQLERNAKNTVIKIYNHETLTREMVLSIVDELEDWAQLESDLKEIGYPYHF